MDQNSTLGAFSEPSAAYEHGTLFKAIHASQEALWESSYVGTLDSLTAVL